MKGKIVGKINEKRKPGYLYYVKGENVIRKTMSWNSHRAKSKKVKR